MMIRDARLGGPLSLGVRLRGLDDQWVSGVLTAMDSAGLSRSGPNPVAERRNARSTARPVDRFVPRGSIAHRRSSPRRASGGNSGGVRHLRTARNLARQRTLPAPHSPSVHRRCTASAATDKSPLSTWPRSKRSSPIRDRTGSPRRGASGRSGTQRLLESSAGSNRHHPMSLNAVRAGGRTCGFAFGR